MYSIFNCHSKKSVRLEEGEPPPKKLDLEKNQQIKTLSKQQLNTKTSLSEQLMHKKDFISNDVTTDIYGNIKGTTTLTEFKEKVDIRNKLNKLKSQGLCEQDTQMFYEYKSLEEFWTKYRDISKDSLCERIRVIERSTSSNRLTSEPLLIHPMDEIEQLAKQINENETSKFNIKKIRKKARSLGNKMKSTDYQQIVDQIVRSSKQKQNESTLWDVKEVQSNTQKKIEVKSKDKIYTCKPQNFYTIKDGKIIKLTQHQESSGSSLNVLQEELKLSVEEIKKIPKFSNYDPGNPSKVLYLKNLSNAITESCLRALLKTVASSFEIKIMNGKMRGQGFIEFKDETVSFEALQILNGTVIGGKPMIVQFGVGGKKS